MVKPLEDFFREGNKLGVVGSFVYGNIKTSDVDVVLFTRHDADFNPYELDFHKELSRWFKHKYQTRSEVDFDFVGPQEESDLDQEVKSKPLTYKLDNLSTNDPFLDGYFLTGRFFPNKTFLTRHYQSIFNGNPYVGAWQRFAADVKDFTIRGDRLGKEENDFLLILSATRTLSKTKSELKPLIEKYSQTYQNLSGEYCFGNTIIEYYSQLRKVTHKLISEAKRIITN